MGCIKLKACILKPLSMQIRLNPEIQIFTLMLTKPKSPLLLITKKLDDLNIKVLKDDKHLLLRVLWSNPLHVAIEMTCSTPNLSDKYLRVSPEEIQWISDYESIIYDITSNTNWQVI